MTPYKVSHLVHLVNHLHVLNQLHADYHMMNQLHVDCNGMF